jgi:hypothetical protein
MLGRFGHPFRKRGHISIAAVVFKHLSTIFGHHGYIDIEHLAGLVGHLMILTGRQRAAVDLDRFDDIRIIDCAFSIVA